MPRLAVAILALVTASAGALLAQEKAGEADVVARTRGQLKGLRETLERLRGEKLLHEIAIGQAEEKTLISSDIDDYDARGAQIARAYGRIGLFPKGYDLRDFARGFAAQVVAYYEPKKKTFFVVKTGLSDEGTAIHELQHALQDQRFDLVAYYRLRDPDPIATNDDAALARRFVVEGEASYVAAVFEAQRRGQPEGAESYVEKLASFRRDELSRLERRYAAQAEGGRQMIAALNARDDLPDYLYHQMLDPYLKGAAVIGRVRKRGGWKAVDELFRRPPGSTKELLFPDRPRPGERPELVDLAAAIGGGYKRTLENTLGVMGVRCALEARALTRKLPDVAERVASRWAGDRFQSYENRQGDTCAVWLTAWEDEEAAKDFEVGAKELLRSESGTTTLSFVERRKQRVFLALGVPRRKMSAVIEAALGPKEARAGK